MTSDELLSSGHFQMPFDIVRDGEEQSAYMYVDKDNSSIHFRGVPLHKNWIDYCLFSRCVIMSFVFHAMIHDSPRLAYTIGKKDYHARLNVITVLTVDYIILCIAEWQVKLHDILIGLCRSGSKYEYSTLYACTCSFSQDSCTSCLSCQNANCHFNYLHIPYIDRYWAEFPGQVSPGQRSHRGAKTENWKTGN